MTELLLIKVTVLSTSVESRLTVKFGEDVPYINSIKLLRRNK